MSTLILALLTTVSVVDPPDTNQAAETILEHVVEKNTASANPLDELIDSFNREGVTALRELWTDLGVTSSMFSGLAETDPVQVARFSLDLNGNGSNETLLRITDNEDADYQFLAISHNGESWTNHGVIEYWNQKDTIPEYRLETLDTIKRWLVIRSLKGRGNGFERYQETWYDSMNSLTSVLHYPVKGNVSRDGLSFHRTFTGSSNGASGSGDQPVITIEMNVRYTNGSVFTIADLDELFSRQATLKYSYDQDESRFTLDESSSGMTQVEVVGIYADDSDGFLQHNFSQLKNMAANGDEARKTWLRKFLDTRGDSTEKTVLLQLLDPESVSPDSEEELQGE